MNKTPLTPAVVLLPLFLLAAGCVSKKDHEAARAELAACQEETEKLEDSVIAWEERFDRESTRWTQVETSVTQALPAALSEFHAERDRIVELVPEQVRSEVESYLDGYFATVAKGFRRLADDNDEIKLQLRETRKALDAVGADTRSIGTAIDETVADERAKREAERARRDRVTDHLAEVVEQVVEFDQTRINCKQCPERLKLNRKERETILGFHAELVSDLSDLQRFAGESDLTGAAMAGSE